MAQRGLTSRQTSRVEQRRQALGIEVREIRSRRTSWNVRPESRFQYDQLVASGVVNRDEWARVIREILELEAAPLTEGGKPRTHGSKTRFAAKAGIAVRTVDSWLHSDVDVKEASVRAVADGYGINAMNLLIRVGFYKIEELPPRLTDEQIDEEQRAVLDRSDLDDGQKAYILQELEAMRSTDERILEEQRARDRQRREQRIAEMIERASERRTA